MMSQFVLLCLLPLITAAFSIEALFQQSRKERPYDPPPFWEENNGQHREWRQGQGYGQSYYGQSQGGQEAPQAYGLNQNAQVQPVRGNYWGNELDWLCMSGTGCDDRNEVVNGIYEPGEPVEITYRDVKYGHGQGEFGPTGSQSYQFGQNPPAVDLSSLDQFGVEENQADQNSYQSGHYSQGQFSQSNSYSENQIDQNLYAQAQSGQTHYLDGQLGEANFGQRHQLGQNQNWRGQIGGQSQNKVVRPNWSVKKRSGSLSGQGKGSQGGYGQIYNSMNHAQSNGQGYLQYR